MPQLATDCVERKPPGKMIEYTRAPTLARHCSKVHERIGHCSVIANRYQTADGGISGNPAEGRDIGHDRRQTTGEGLDQRESAALPMARGDKKIGCTRKVLDIGMRNRTEQVHTIAQDP